MALYRDRWLDALLTDDLTASTFGGPDGEKLLVAFDIISRLPLAPQELPVGNYHLSLVDFRASVALQNVADGH